jgi:hypothetical protein
MAAPAAFAQEAAFALKASAEIKDILVQNTGKRVALRLASGDEIEGTVTTVGNSLVHVSRLAGKEFYDSVVSIDKISAVRMKVRER